MSCNYSAGKKRSALNSQDCRDLYSTNERCHLGELGEAESISKTFTSSNGEQTWSESEGNFAGFNLVLASGSFEAPMTVTAKLLLSKTSHASYLELEANQKLTANFQLNLPHLMRNRFEVESYTDLIVNYSDKYGMSQTLVNEATKTSDGYVLIKFQDWGRFAVARAKEPPLIKIVLDKTDTTIVHKQTAQIKAMGTYSDGSTKDITAQVQWEMENPTLAELDLEAEEPGIFKGLIPGSTAIAAKFKDQTGLGTLTVTDPVIAEIIISPENTEIPRGGTHLFTALGKISDDSERDVTNEVTWSTADTAILSTSESTKGLATGVEIGETYIIATAEYVSSQIVVKVIAPELESITIDQIDPSHPHSSTFAFTATGHYKDGSTADITSTVTWASSDLSKATISSEAPNNGIATTVAVGTTTISATIGDISGETELTIVGQEATQLVFRRQPEAGGISGTQIKLIAGLVLNRNIEVIGADAQGNVDPSFTGEVTLSLNTIHPAANTLTLSDDDGGTITATAVNGVATFGSVRLSYTAGDSFSNAAQHNSNTPTFTLTATTNATVDDQPFAAITTNQFSPVAPFSGGNGDLATPYLISSLTDLDAVRLVQSDIKYFKLTTDLDATETKDWNGGRGFLPIGYTYPPDGNVVAFKGNFDGNGKSISALTIKTGTGGFTLGTGVGLFGRAEADINKLTLANISISGSSNHVGGIVGEFSVSGSSLEECHVSGSIAGYQRVGGIVGLLSNSANVAGVSVNATVSGVTQTGGIVGRQNISSTLSRCVGNAVVIVSGELSGAANGGLIGSMDNSTISDCISLGGISGPSTIGGFIGAVSHNSAQINRSIAHTQVTSTSGTAGGFIGVFREGTIRHAISSGNIGSTSTSDGKVGGFAGSLEGSPNTNPSDANIDYSASSGNLYAAAGPIGGFIGQNGFYEIDKTRTYDVSYSATNSVIGYSASVTASSRGGFAGIKESNATQNHIAASTRLTNGENCIGSNKTLDPIASSSCPSSATAYVHRADQLGFERHYITGRKIGASESSAFSLSGYCPIAKQGKTIYLTATSGADSVEVSTSCKGGSWNGTLNLTSIADGNLTLSLELIDNCTRGEGCESSEVSMTKSSAVCSSSTGSPFQSGDGSSGSPFLICSKTQMLNMANYHLNEKYFKLGTSIDLDSVPMPITPEAEPFIGHLDGDGYLLRNISCRKTSSDYCGLFAKIEGTGSARNIQIENALLTGRSYVGALAGSINSTATFDNIGILAAAVASTDRAGILTGYAANASFAKLRMAGGVSVPTLGGGVAGSASGLSITTSQSFASIVGSQSGHGSLVGSLSGSSSISKSFAVGNVSNVSGDAGGLVGVLAGGSISDSYANGIVISTASGIGGLIGRSSQSSTISRTYASGIVIGHPSADLARGGLTGSLSDGSALSDSFASTLVLPNSGNYSGTVTGLFGVSGQSTEPDISDSDFLANASNPSNCIGGSTSGSSAPAAGDCETQATLGDIDQLNTSGGTWNFSTIWQSIHDDLPMLRDALDR